MVTASLKQAISFFALFIFILFAGCDRCYNSYRVNSESMIPTYNPSEIVIVNSCAYRNDRPRRWDVVVFRPPSHEDQYWMMRVVGLPEEFVTIKDGSVVVNDVVMPVPSYLIHVAYSLGIDRLPTLKPTRHPYHVPKGHYYLLGDNPSKSNDSRFIGAVSVDDIEGRVEHSEDKLK
jgi:signal peptidase I